MLGLFSLLSGEYYLKLAIYIFSYLKKFKPKKIAIDSKLLLIEKQFDMGDSSRPDFLEDYKDVTGEKDKNTPSYREELDTLIFFDAYYAHDYKTLRFITQIIVVVGGTSSVVSSKQQGCITTSTYCVEFSASGRSGNLFEIYFWSIGPVTISTTLFGDNLGVIQNSNIPDSDL